MNELQYLALNQLRDVSEINPINDTDRECLAEVRDVLRKFGKLERFGITLLHKHFDLVEDEILVEEVDEINRVQVIKPMKKSAVDESGGEILETMWSLHEGEVLMGCKRRCVYQDGKHYKDVHTFG
ncbi:hypothetical protein [Dawidia soli]|uniref:Uncharacterized protein n=1 Tax=Dawidia soli TaxID=2782352 RepID=A0AAP2DEW0_9BACT|nr:hypothetical protein [Dawidia soli]MBT1689861.1 hypothetical protein [Dawidia soli]